MTGLLGLAPGHLCVLCLDVGPAAGVTSQGPDSVLVIAARHGCHPLRGVATYEDLYRLTYVRGPSGILVMLAQELQRT